MSYAIRFPEKGRGQTPTELELNNEYLRQACTVMTGHPRHLPNQAKRQAGGAHLYQKILAGHQNLNKHLPQLPQCGKIEYD
jgi:hypothetical protein